MAAKEIKTVGVIDIGSNSIRLSIYKCENGSSRLMLNKKKMTGLAQYVRNGILGKDGIKEAVSAVRLFRQRQYEV